MIFLCLTYLKKAPTRLTRKICEFEAAYLSDMYHYITAALYRRQTAHLHETISQFFIIILKVVRLSLDFMWNGSVFQISGPRYLILLAPKVTWFIMGTSRLGLYWFRIALLVFLSSKMPFIKVGFILFTVLKRFTVQSSNVPCTFTSTFYDRLIWGIIIVK